MNVYARRIMYEAHFQIRHSVGDSYCRPATALYVIVLAQMK